jgi:hypothetical protein
VKRRRVRRRRSAAFLAVTALVVLAVVAHRLGMRARRGAPGRSADPPPAQQHPGAGRAGTPELSARTVLESDTGSGSSLAHEAVPAREAPPPRDPGVLAFEIVLPEAAEPLVLEFVLLTEDGEEAGTHELPRSERRIRFDALVEGDAYIGRIDGFRWLGAPLEVGRWHAVPHGAERPIRIDLSGEIFVTEFRFDISLEDYPVDVIAPGLFFAGTPDRPGTMRGRWRATLAHAFGTRAVRLDAPGRRHAVVAIEHPVTTFRLEPAPWFTVRLRGLDDLPADVGWDLYADPPGYPPGEEYGIDDRAVATRTAMFPRVVEGDWRFEFHLFRRIGTAAISLDEPQYVYVTRVEDDGPLELVIPEELVRTFREPL